MNQTWELFKRLLRGERAERPEPLPNCDACGEQIIAPGYVYMGQFFCDVYCCPPFQVHGDPGHA